MLRQNSKVKLIVCLIFLLGTTPVFTQSKFEIGINASPSFLSVKPEASSSKYNYTNFGFVGGMNLIYNLNPRSSFSIGIQNFNAKYSVSYNFIYIQSGDPAIPVSGSFKIFYLGVPIKYNCNIYSKSKSVFSISMGFCQFFLMSSEDKTTFADNSVRESGSLNSKISSFQIGVGYSYKIKERISLKFEPEYRVFLKGIDTMMNQNPTLLLISVSCIINLNSGTSE